MAHQQGDDGAAEEGKAGPIRNTKRVSRRNFFLLIAIWCAVLLTVFLLGALKHLGPSAWNEIWNGIAPSASVSAKATVPLGESTRIAADTEHCYYNGMAFNPSTSNALGQTCIAPTVAHWFPDSRDAEVGVLLHGGGGTGLTSTEPPSFPTLRHSFEASVEFGLAASLRDVLDHPAFFGVVLLLGWILGAIVRSVRIAMALLGEWRRQKMAQAYATLGVHDGRGTR